VSETFAVEGSGLADASATGCTMRDLARIASSRPPLVPVVKAADLREGSDPAGFRCLDGPRFRRVLVQGEVRPGVVIDATNDFAWRYSEASLKTVTWSKCQSRVPHKPCANG